MSDFSPSSPAKLKADPPSKLLRYDWCLTSTELPEFVSLLTGSGTMNFIQMTQDITSLKSGEAGDHHSASIADSTSTTSNPTDISVPPPQR